MQDPFLFPVAAEVRQDEESEAALVRRAKKSLSDGAWTVGECAAKWTERWAKGRTDEDFGAMIGMSGDQVGQRRRVHERFGNYDTCRNLSWSHYRAALNWDDADTCLAWAYEQQATVAEMTAWRDVQHGEYDTCRNIDPSGEGDGTGEEAGGEEAGTESGAGTETGGNESQQEQPPPPPRKGMDKRGGVSTPPKDPFLVEKAKTIKTLEALSRAIDDVHKVRPIPQHDAMMAAVLKMIETAKTW
jgi:hypothetical protein